MSYWQVERPTESVEQVRNPMPTDLATAMRRRRQARRQRNATMGVLTACFIICLINIALLFVAPALARAVELMSYF